MPKPHVNNFMEHKDFVEFDLVVRDDDGETFGGGRVILSTGGTKVAREAAFDAAVAKIVAEGDAAFPKKTVQEPTTPSMREIGQLAKARRDAR